MKQHLLRISSSWIWGCRLRGALLRRIGFPLPPDGKISCHTRLGGFDIRIGTDFAANERCWIDDHVAIGDHVRMGHGVKLVTATHPVGPTAKRRGEADINRPVVIEDGVWLWADARVQPGVTIARGCIVATAAVVVKDTRPNGFYAGNPAERVADITGDGRFLAIPRARTPASRSGQDLEADRRQASATTRRDPDTPFGRGWTQGGPGVSSIRSLRHVLQPPPLAQRRSGSRGHRRSS